MVACSLLLSSWSSQHFYPKQADESFPNFAHSPPPEYIAENTIKQYVTILYYRQIQSTIDHEYKLKQDYKLKTLPLLANIFRNMKLTLS